MPTEREREIESRARAVAERIANLFAIFWGLKHKREHYTDLVARVIAEEMAKLDEPQAPREVGGSIGYD